MLRLNYKSAASRNTIIRLLLLAFVVCVLFPFHYHIHHVEDPAAQDAETAVHVADIHVHSEAVDLSHHADSHTVELSTQITLKSSASQLPWIAILVGIVLTLPFLAQASQNFPLPMQHRLPRSNCHTTPPLRAPPRH